MTKHYFSIKTLFFAIVVTLSLLLGSNAFALGAVLNSGNSTLKAESSAIHSQSVTSFTNSNFESNSGSSTQPMTPSNWNVTSDSSSKKEQISGLITLDATSLQQNKSALGLDGYSNPPLINPDNLTNRVLMINSDGNSQVYGYEASSSITLEANSYYAIQANVYIDNATASLYLSGSDFDNLPNSKIYVHQSTGNQSWRNVIFYIKTSNIKASDVKLQLYLGQKAHTNDQTVKTSEGFVLFDNIVINRLSGSKFKNTATQNINTSIIDLNDTKAVIQSGSAGFIQNGDFSNNSTGWTEETANSNGTITFTDSLNTEKLINNEKVILGNRQGETNNNNGLILSASKGFVSVKSSDIQIKQHQTYKISFWAKGKLSSGNVNFVLSGNLPEQTTAEKTLQSETISTLNTNNNALNNGWNLYEFYVVGNPLADSTINLSLGLGTSSEKATGYVAITDISSQLVTTEQITNGTENNSNAKTLNMYPTISQTFTNFSFNFANIDEISSTVNYPLSPQNWTEENANNTKSGVVNISSAIWNSNASLSSLSRPSKSALDYSDNVLMLNVENSYQGYTSETTSFGTGDSGYAKFTIDVNVKSLIKGSAFITIINSDNIELAKIKLDSTTTGWKTYTIYLQNFNTSQTISAKINLGTKEQPATAIAYFDNCKINTSITKEDFNSAINNDTTQKISLITDLLNVENGNQDPLYFDFNEVENTDNTAITKGIINTESFDSYHINDENPQVPADSETSKVLVIGSNSPVYAYYNSTLTYKFSSETYYKLSVFVKTSQLTQDNETEFNDNGQLVVHGASIVVTNIDQNFISINTNNNGSNEWQEYVMYIYTTKETTSNIQLGLGYQGMATAGFAYFANLEVTQLSEDEYNNEILTYDENNLPNNVLLATNTPDEEEEQNPSGFGNIDPFAISTLIIALAIVVAIIGVVIKKFYHARPKKTAVINNNYDRLDTLLKDVDRRERKTAINHKLKLLKEELAQSEKFLAEEVAELKKLNDSFNTAKEIAKDSPTVQLEEPDTTQIQQNIETQTNKIKQIEYDIEVLETEKDKIEKQNKKAIENRDKQNSVKIKKRK